MMKHEHDHPVAAAVTGIMIVVLMSAVSVNATAGENSGDPQRGKYLGYTCYTCHYIGEGMVHHTGPNLYGMFSRQAGTAPGYEKYSTALKESGIRWTASQLDQWLANPRDWLPGTTMIFTGISDPRQRADLISWLEQATGK